eukprot:TRINITY_DN1934_c0_g1_i1.p1 TRINITY_DN1934_c0_g1~~TRINITY_DN1934_c0_g1_i1.p1  ORF type:complete len:224 (+),score=41.10 TRINITY_DN1934_c0_g1_i1:416-1087(+)
MQSLYHSSEKMFVSLIQFLPANDSETDILIALTTTVLFRGLNQLWVPSLMKHGEFLYYGPCTKWIISEDDLNTRRLTQNQTFDPSLLGLHWDVLKDSDVQTVLDHNKIKHEPDALRNAIKISVCLRDASGRPVSWGASHWDLSIACLHTLEEYRGKDLGRQVIWALGQRQFDAMRSVMSARPLYMHGDVEDYNEASRQFLTKCGFTKVVDNVWTEWKKSSALQ